MRQNTFRMIYSNGVMLRVVVEGQGPLVLMLHGFPQCWYLWRRQIDVVVAAGFQVAVPDQRGYGGSSKPAAPDAYACGMLMADVVGIAEALGHESFTLVTHDYGAALGWDIALAYRERVAGVFALSVPPSRRQEQTARRSHDGGNEFRHYLYFQQPEVPEAELDADIRKSLRMLHYAMSGDAPEGLFVRPKPPDSRLLDGLIDPQPLPRWLTDSDLDVYADAYRDGFRGPINWYRGYRRDDQLFAGPLPPISVPSHLMVGTRDASLVLLAEAFAAVEQNVIDLRGNIVLEGAGHWLPLERTQEVNAALLSFLGGLHR
jgi:pimeloyl-ACP methyl ester carboxylesterase